MNETANLTTTNSGLVAKCTGHTTAKTVRDHYYNPTREHTRQAMRRVEAQISGRKRVSRASNPNVEKLAKQAEELSVAERKQLAALLEEGSL